MLKSLLPVLHPHRTFQFHHRHCCLRLPVVRSVGCLSAMWLILRRLVLSSSAARFRILSSADNSAISLSMVWWLSWSFIVYSSHWSTVFIPGLSGGNSPKISEISQKFKMNYAKIEFLSISGVIFSPASGGFAPRPTPGLCPWSRFAFTVLTAPHLVS